jgi:ArsR family transcriptional regulator
MEKPSRLVFAQFAEVAQALSHQSRLELLEMLAQSERSVEALAELTDLKISNASQHLQLLRRAGLVVARKKGTQVLYRLAARDVVTLITALRQTTERGTAEIAKVVDSYFHDRDSLDPVSQETLLADLRLGLVTLLDVRPSDEFDAGHIPGAVNIPLDELEKRLGDLPKRRPIVAYCRGPYCVLSFEAVAALRARGFKVRRLAEGFPEWWAAGRPIEQTPHGQ